jgi:hypothetical protein|nr:MAG TPA: hypothetical protein [Caudoviricetes sp.]
MTEPLYDIEEFKKHCLALVDMTPHVVSARHFTRDMGSGFTETLLLVIGTVEGNAEAVSRGIDPVFT